MDIMNFMKAAHVLQATFYVTSYLLIHRTDNKFVSIGSLNKYKKICPGNTEFQLGRVLPKM